MGFNKQKGRRNSKSVRQMRGRVQACEMEVQRLSELVINGDRKIVSLEGVINNISVTNRRVASLFAFLDKLFFWRGRGKLKASKGARP